MRGAEGQRRGRLVLPVLYQLHPLVQLGGSGADEGLGVQHRTWKRKRRRREERRKLKHNEVFFLLLFFNGDSRT